MPSSLRIRAVSFASPGFARTNLLVFACSILVCSLAAVAQAGPQTAPTPSTRILVSSISPSTAHVGSSGALGTVYAEGTTLTFAGRALNAPTKAKVALEAASGGGWRTEAQAPLSKSASFKLSWTLNTVGPATIRIAVKTSAGRSVASAAVQSTRILKDGCAIPQIAQADPDDGLIVGGCTSRAPTSKAAR